MDRDVLDGLLRPQSIAVVGASTTKGKIGHTVVEKILEGGYEGEVYPINPKADEILRLKAYPSVLDVPGEIDAAVIVVPAPTVPQVAKECGEKGVKGLIIIASGFSEAGHPELEEEVVKIARQYGMRVLGPNVVGILSNSDKCNASFAPFLPLPGKAAMVSQSGALLVAMDASTYTRNVGFDKMIPLGNTSDVNFGDVIEWLNEDENVTCISLYIEGMKDGRHFIEATCASKKPIVALKSGVSKHGAAAAASHTGSLAGSGEVYTAAFDQTGVVHADSLNNLFDRTQALSLQPAMEGTNLLVITNGGGVGVLSTDAAERYDLPLQFAPDDLQAELKTYMPEYGSAKNPVDLTGMVRAEHYYGSVSCALKHDWVDALVVLYCRTPMTDPMKIAEGICEAVNDADQTDKPVAVSFIGGEASDEAMQWLVEQGLPAYDEPSAAVNAIAALHEYAQNHIAEPFQPFDDADEELARSIIEQAQAEGRSHLTEIESHRVFQAYGLPVAETALATDEDEAVARADEIGYPVAMKIASPDVLHKSDTGGVEIDVQNADMVREAYRAILENVRARQADAEIEGLVVQAMAPSGGTEVILGSVNDLSFGPTVMFGLGGIFVEVLNDVVFRVAPISKRVAHDMLTDVDSAPILEGVRGEKPRDRQALAEALSRYSQLVTDLGDLIAESDANPAIVYAEGQGLTIVDARIILKTS